jgi:hypothetical protein
MEVMLLGVGDGFLLEAFSFQFYGDTASTAIKIGLPLFLFLFSIIVCVLSKGGVKSRLAHERGVCL